MDVPVPDISKEAEKYNENEDVSMATVSPVEDSSPSQSWVLLIGIHFNWSLISQFIDKNLTCLSHCVDVQGKIIEQNVLRDTWRCNGI